MLSAYCYYRIKILLIHCCCCCCCCCWLLQIPLLPVVCRSVSVDTFARRRCRISVKLRVFRYNDYTCAKCKFTPRPLGFYKTKQKRHFGSVHQLCRSHLQMKPYTKKKLSCRGNLAMLCVTEYFLKWLKVAQDCSRSFEMTPSSRAYVSHYYNSIVTVYLILFLRYSTYHIMAWPWNLS